MTKKTSKVVVFDTSVLLYDANSIFGFKGNDIVIPITVLDEVDKYKVIEDEVGRNARKFIRSLRSFLSAGENFRAGVKRLPTEELLIIKDIEDTELLHTALDSKKNDDKIIAVCLELQKKEKYKQVKLITRDAGMLVKASYLGVVCEDYLDEAGYVEKEDLYSGVKTFSVPSDFIDELYTDGKLDLCIGDIGEYIQASIFDGLDNVGVILNSNTSPNHSALSVYKNGCLCRSKYQGKVINKVTPKNAEQQLAMDFLLDPAISLVTMTGSAGVGKTLLAIACCLHQLDKGKYKKMVVSRPIQPMGKDLGFLPGSIEEKLAPWMTPIRDAVEFMGYRFEDLVAFGSLEIEPLTYIRGRSIPNTIFVLDEAQNLSKHEMKAVITRMGKDSKLILTGDVFQIDSPYLDSTTNGLTRVVELFKPYSLSAHVALTKGQRSELATLAASIM